MSEEKDAEDLSNGISTRDRTDSNSESKFANLHVALHDFQLVSEVISLDSIGKEYGTKKEIEIGHGVLSRSLVHSLEDLSEEDIRQGMASGLITETDAMKAIQFKRQLELAERRDHFIREGDRDRPMQEP